MRNLIAFAVCLVCLGGAANAQLVVGVDDPNVPVYVINVNDDTATPLFSGYEVWGMAADDPGGLLYFNDGVELYRVPYGTLVPEYVADITYEGAVSSMVGLAFNPLTGKLYGTKNISTEAVYEIDPLTGVASLLYAYDTAYDFGGFDYDTQTGAFYGLNDGSGAPGGRGLFSIDPFGQSAGFIVGYPEGQTDIDGLATGGGKAYFVVDEPGSIYVYNMLTSQFENPLTSPWTSSEIFSAGAWAPGIPEPTGVSLLALGVLGFFGLRRRR